MKLSIDNFKIMKYNCAITKILKHGGRKRSSRKKARSEEKYCQRWQKVRKKMGKNEMLVFKSDEFGQVRTVLRDGEPWFVAADVCKALELGDTWKAVERLDDDEKGTNSIRTPGGDQNMTIVNEPGLYSLVLGSRKPEAKRFKRWITHDVLPSIRKYGLYAASGIFTNPDTMAALVQALQHEQERGEKLERRLNWLTSPSAQKVLEAERARKEDGDDMPERSARLFLDTINKALDEGEARVRMLGGTGDEDGEESDEDDDSVIGFMDKDYLYAIPKRTYETVARHCKTEGDSFPISQKMLNRCLREQGLIEPDKTTGTATRPKRVSGQTKRLLWILRSKMR